MEERQDNNFTAVPSLRSHGPQGPSCATTAYKRTAPRSQTCQTNQNPLNSDRRTVFHLSWRSSPPTRSGDGDAAAPQTCGSAGRRGEAPPRGGPGTPRRQRLHGGRAEADPGEPPSPSPPLRLRRSPCTPRERRRPHPARTAARGAGAPSQPRPAAATHRRCGRYRRAAAAAPPLPRAAAEGPGGAARWPQTEPSAIARVGRRAAVALATPPPRCPWVTAQRGRSGACPSRRPVGSDAVATVTTLPLDLPRGSPRGLGCGGASSRSPAQSGGRDAPRASGGAPL